MNYSIFTSESVASGHPDKVSDQVSDAIVDAAIRAYPASRVAIETLVTKDRVVLAGEVTCLKKLDYEKIARNVIQGLGYDKKEYQFWHESPIEIYVHSQSPEISMGVDTGGAGDQGMMFGYAANETPELMPLPIMLSHRLVMAMDEARTSRKLPYLKPDGKSEVKVLYENGKPKSVAHVVLAVPHDENITAEQLHQDLYDQVVKTVLSEYGYEVSPQEFVVNGTGKWILGGPATDTGVTGRKIIVDTYGGMARQGGGCFSGKDVTKVDRSGAYAARYIAKNIIAKGLADRVEVQLAYVIGHREPLTKCIDTFGTEKTSIKEIEDYAWNLLDLTPAGIIEGLKLRQPIYQKSASYGHFGRDVFPWEKIVS